MSKSLINEPRAIKDQFSSEIAPGVECYHEGAIIFAGGPEHMEQAKQVVKDWDLKDDEWEIQEDLHENIMVILIKDVIQ